MDRRLTLCMLLAATTVGGCFPGPLPLDGSDGTTALDTADVTDSVGSDTDDDIAETSNVETTGDVDAATCAGGCSHLDGPCAEGICLNGSCLIEPKTGSCDDGLHCTTNDHCDGTNCVGEPRQCDDGVGCSVDGCTEADGGCTSDTSSCGCVADDDCDNRNPCDGTETCGADNKCKVGVPVTCPPASDPCLVNLCSQTSGTCTLQPGNDGAVCNDGLFCTKTDRCTDGVCEGSLVDCPGDSLSCTREECDEELNACVTDFTECGPCDDDADCANGNLCDGVETCGADGRCVAGQVVICPESQNPCREAVCTPATGNCNSLDVLDDTPCSDDDACTVDDRCASGHCESGAPIVCSPLDACHSAGSCDSGTGVCSNPKVDDATECDDGSACTLNDVCRDGICVGEAPVECAPMGACRAEGVCNPSTGACSNPPGTDGTECHDGDACTNVDECRAGECVGLQPTACVAIDACHDPGVCDPGSGLCSTPSASNGTDCDDLDPCTVEDSCQSGRCEGQTRSCDDSVACTVDTCQPDGSCENAPTEACDCVSDAQCDDGDPCNGVETCDRETLHCASGTTATNGAPCDDNDACTLSDTCQGGVCNGSQNKACPPINACHNPGVCLPNTGECVPQPKNDGTSCNDGDLCTTSDKCSAGTCGGTAVTCGASDQCHLPGTCDAGTGQCTNPKKNDGAECNDGSACTRADECVDGVCVGADPVVCAPPPSCRAEGVCQTGTGTCTYAALGDNSPCDDANACTGTSACIAGSCVGGSPVTCQPLDSCHTSGVCDVATGACSNPEKSDNATCDDGDLCTQTDRCSSGSCVGSDPKTCTPLSQCHLAGICNGATGLCSNPTKPENSTCNDTNACTQLDRCKSGSCVGENPVVCTAQSQCHNVGTCNTASGVCSNPPKLSGSPCSDGNACTTVDSCQSGACVGSQPVTCTSSDQCKDGVCNTLSGECEELPREDGTTCDDGSACTVADTCLGGLCQPGLPETCADATQCNTNVTCDPSLGCVGSELPRDTVCDAESTNDGFCRNGECGRKQLAVGSDHTCIALGDGAVRCWGFNTYGQLGYGNTDAIGDDETLASLGSAGDVQVGFDVYLVSAYDRMTCAVARDRQSIRCWGSGNLINGPIGDNELPAAAPLLSAGEDVKKIEVGRSHVCLLLESGRVRCWGDNYRGRLGLGDETGRSLVQLVEQDLSVPLGNPAIDICAGTTHSCAVLADGVVRCWGDNEYGQLGTGSGSIGDNETPVAVTPVPVAGFAHGIDCDAYLTCAVVETTGVQCWGMNSNGALGISEEDTSLVIGDDEDISALGVLDFASPIASVHANYMVPCVHFSDGSAKCWGRIAANGMGPVIYGDNELAPTAPTIAFPSPVRQIVTAGGQRQCAILTSGSVQCWGFTNQVELGWPNQQFWSGDYGAPSQNIQIDN